AAFDLIVQADDPVIAVASPRSARRIVDRDGSNSAVPRDERQRRARRNPRDVDVGETPAKGRNERRRANDVAKRAGFDQRDLHRHANAAWLRRPSTDSPIRRQSYSARTSAA